MPRVGINDVDNYSSSGGNFFSLKDDGDMAVVRFMYNDLKDVVADVVHQVTLPDGSRRWVLCLKKSNEPISACPFCEAAHFKSEGNISKYRTRFFIPLFNVDTGEALIWERGINFQPKLEGLFSRYGKKTPLVSTPFELERHGKKGDTNTIYETYPLDTDDVLLEDLPELPEIVGKAVYEKTFDEMIDFIETGVFDSELPKTANRAERRKRTPASEEPIRRRTTTARSSETRRRPTVEDEDVPEEKVPHRRRPESNDEEEF